MTAIHDSCNANAGTLAGDTTVPMSCAARTVPVVAALLAPSRATRHENWPSAPADDCWMGILSAPLGRGAGASSSPASADA